MTYYDIFNGDADGICALVQLRLAEPRNATLITGVKRDINLLDKITPVAGDQITVLDVSMRSNAAGLKVALDAGANVFYVDHHNSGDIPDHKNLRAIIDTSPKVCTSLLVNGYLENAYAEWAVTAAFGDNMQPSALQLSAPLNLTTEETEKLKTFGELLNYNGYGRDVSDLYYAPDQLFKLLSDYKRPSLCFTEQPEIFDSLLAGYTDDMKSARQSEKLNDNIMLLSDAPWARRISGSFGNILATDEPEQAHAVLTYNATGGYTVSVRAPLNSPKNADVLCLKFKTGGGRAAAAGINHLSQDDLALFIQEFSDIF